MSGELKHSSVGTSLTQAEFESIGLHVLDGQAQGDIIYASSTTQLSRLAKGTAGQVLTMNAGATAPEWSAAGSGDVSGPGSSVDNAIARFNGTGGKTIQDYTSGAPTIGDTGTIYIFDVGGETISGDGTDLTIASGSDINLTATNDINVPANVGVTFGDDGEKIEGDGTDLTIASSGILNLSATSVLLAENTGIKLDATLSADGKYSGIVEAGTLGETCIFGDLVYFKAADSEWYKAKADASATSGAVKVGICLDAGNDGDSTTILLWGKVRADAAFPSFTLSAPIFIDAATAGDLTNTAPSGTTDFVVRIVGYGVTANVMHFCPDNTYLELA